MDQPDTGIDLLWLPLGAGGHSVRLNGLVAEWVAARLAHRERCDLYHSGLVVRVPEGRFVIEQAPAWRERRGARRRRHRCRRLPGRRPLPALPLRGALLA